MDPRTAATVTAPDLVQAFQEGTGRQEEPHRTDDMNVYVLLMHSLVEGQGDDKPARTFILPAVQLGLALSEIAAWLSAGDGRAAALELGSDVPEGWVDAERAALSPPKD